MLPIVELRGGIPLGVGMGLPLPLAVTAAVIGNMLPVPFIILFIRRIYLWLQRRIPPLRGLLERLERRVEEKKDLVLRYQFWGLLLLVAVPLPGTGAWTGAMVAAVMDLRIKRAVPAIFGGVLLAAAVVTAITMGIFSL
ncbi:MAG: small multi-drug export protein [Oscillospiraceae bacterium]|nr:small multi-drug export protein [Oscillospiraceae bacterium]